VSLNGNVSNNIYPFVLGRRRLGDERDIATAKNRQERIKAIRNAQRAYQGLYVVLRGQGLFDAAAPHRLREQRLRRRELRTRGNLLGWLFYWLLDIVAGYGEKPRRTLLWYLATILSFAAALALLAPGGISQANLLNALIDSVLSFHGRGLAPNTSFTTSTVPALSAVETIIGLFIEISFIATFVQRYFHR
jgi:hypothetical protein